MRTLLQICLALFLSMIFVTICYAEVSNVKIYHGPSVREVGESVNDLKMGIMTYQQDYLIGEPIQVTYQIGTDREIPPGSIVVIEKGPYFDKVALSFSVKDSSGKELTKIEKDKSVPR